MATPMTDSPLRHISEWGVGLTPNMCAVGGCGSAGPNQVLMLWRIGEQEFDLETALCDYHLGWYEAWAGRVNASLVAA